MFLNFSTAPNQIWTAEYAGILAVYITLGVSVDNNTQQDLIKTLALFADGKPRDASDGYVVDVAHAKWLYEEGFLKGIDATTIHDSAPTYLDLTITSTGIEFLQQKQKEIAERPNKETAYEKNHPMRSKVVVGIVVGLLVALVVAVFRWITHGNYP